MYFVAKDDRYSQMEYRRAGDSGLKLPVISLGLWHNFGTDDNKTNMKDLCFTAFDQGITYFDLANNYGPLAGSAETNFGEILKQEMSAYRDEMIVATKAGFKMWKGPYGDMGSRKYLFASLEQSLKRLQLDYVDIFYHHRMDPDTPLEETMGALADIVRSGKALYVGLSNYDGPTMERAAALLNEYRCPFVVNQNRYSMLNLTIEANGLQTACTTTQKGIVAFSPLAQGLLSTKYLHGIPEDSRIKKDGRFLSESSITPELLEMVKDLNKIAEKRDQTLSQMALAYTLFQDNVTTVLIGASKAEQIIENAQTVKNLYFSPDEIKNIKQIFDEYCSGIISR